MDGWMDGWTNERMNGWKDGTEGWMNEWMLVYHPNIGLEYGAKFILNIEQYEHVVGYASGEGVKVTY